MPERDKNIQESSDLMSEWAMDNVKYPCKHCGVSMTANEHKNHNCGKQDTPKQEEVMNDCRKCFTALSEVVGLSKKLEKMNKHELYYDDVSEELTIKLKQAFEIMKGGDMEKCAVKDAPQYKTNNNAFYNLCRINLECKECNHYVDRNCSLGLEKEKIDASTPKQDRVKMFELLRTELFPILDSLRYNPHGIKSDLYPYINQIIPIIIAQHEKGYREGDKKGFERGQREIRCCNNCKNHDNQARICKIAKANTCRFSNRNDSYWEAIDELSKSGKGE